MSIWRLWLKHSAGSPDEYTSAHSLSTNAMCAALAHVSSGAGRGFPHRTGQKQNALLPGRSLPVVRELSIGRSETAARRLACLPMMAPAATRPCDRILCTRNSAGERRTKRQAQASSDACEKSVARTPDFSLIRIGQARIAAGLPAPKNCHPSEWFSAHFPSPLKYALAVLNAASPTDLTWICPGRNRATKGRSYRARSLGRRGSTVV
jgi:hypothetical protein